MHLNKEDILKEIENKGKIEFTCNVGLYVGSKKKGFVCFTSCNDIVYKQCNDKGIVNISWIDLIVNIKDINAILDFIISRGQNAFK